MKRFFMKKQLNKKKTLYVKIANSWRGKGIQDTDQTDKQNSQKQPPDSVQQDPISR